MVCSDFHTEVPEIARMSKKEVEEYRKELDETKIRGGKCPRPVKTWVQCGVGARVLKCLKQ